MRVIVPGGFYSHNAAQKKIWLDYSYYGLGVENVESIRNLTRNSIIYSVKRSIPGITFSNGCITYFKECYSEDADKLQIVLRTPVPDSLDLLEATEGVITLETEGKVLVLPTEIPEALPLFNESTLNPNRLSIAESPFGGLKGSGSPDYAVGTLYTPTDNVYLTDITGQNSTKTLTAGKLKELGYLTVDTTAHTITQEFTVRNDGENDPTVIDACDSTTGWGAAVWSPTFSNQDGELIANGTTPANGSTFVSKAVGNGFNGMKFITFEITSSLTGTLVFSLAANTKSASWSARNFPLSANTKTKFVLPFLAPAGSSGMNPASNSGFDPAYTTTINIGVLTVGSTALALKLDNITADTGKSAYIEAQVSDNLSATSLSLYTHNGTAYQLASTHSLDGAYSQVSQTSANATLLDSTKFDDVYGTGLGRAVFPKGGSGETKAGSSGNITYSANKGTSKRIGLKVDLPPSDNGRTNFNKCRIKTILTYAPDVEGNYSASFDFADSTNTSYGLQNITKPWLALYDPATSLIEFYLHTNRPHALSFKRDETGTIHELSLYPSSGSIYHGQITFADLTLDSDSDLIPDCLEASVSGSITQFLKNYGMVI